MVSRAVVSQSLLVSVLTLIAADATGQSMSFTTVLYLNADAWLVDLGCAQRTGQYVHLRFSLCDLVRLLGFRARDRERVTDRTKQCSGRSVTGRPAVLKLLQGGQTDGQTGSNCRCMIVPVSAYQVSR